MEEKKVLEKIFDTIFNNVERSCEKIIDNDDIYYVLNDHTAICLGDSMNIAVHDKYEHIEYKELFTAHHFDPYRKAFLLTNTNITFPNVKGLIEDEDFWFPPSLYDVMLYGAYALNILSECYQEEIYSSAREKIKKYWSV